MIASENKGIPDIFNVLKREEALKKPKNGLLQKSHVFSKEYERAKFKAMMEIQKLRDENRDYIARVWAMMFRKKIHKSEGIVVITRKDDDIAQKLIAEFKILDVNTVQKYYKTLKVGKLSTRCLLDRADIQRFLDLVDEKEAKKLREMKDLPQLVIYHTSKHRFFTVYPTETVHTKKGNKKIKFKGLEILVTLWSTSCTLTGQLFTSRRLEPNYDYSN